MATVPTGYVFKDVSADKLYPAGSTMPTVGDGDYIVPATTAADGKYHQYTYHKSYMARGISFTNCWVGFVQSRYTSASYSHRVPYGSIADIKVEYFSFAGCQFTSCPTINHSGDTNYLSEKTNLKFVTFEDCTKLTTAPVLPVNIESLNWSFSRTKIASPPSNFSSLTKLKSADYCFNECTNLTSKPAISGLSAFKSAVGMFRNCTGLTGQSLALPSNILDVGRMYEGCTGITSAAKIPGKVTSAYKMFKGCTNLSGIIGIPSNVLSNNVDIFSGTVNRIILVGNPSSSEDYNFDKLKKIANDYSNVYAGVIADVNSFTAIRGIYENGIFTETVNGSWCKLTLTYSAPDVSGALFKIPELKDADNNDVNATWHVGSVSGPVLTSAGMQVESSGTIITCIDLGSSLTSETYKVRTIVDYTYDSINYTYYSNIKNAMLTYSSAVIDINPLGNGMAFWGEVADNYNGLQINKSIDVNGNITASGDMTAGGDVTDGSGNTLSNKLDSADLPTNVSEFTNDAGYVAENSNGDLSVTRNLTAGGSVTDGNGNVLSAKANSANMFYITNVTPSGYNFSANQYRSLSSSGITTYSGYTPIIVQARCTNKSGLHVLNYSISGTTLNYEVINRTGSQVNDANFAFRILHIRNELIG